MRNSGTPAEGFAPATLADWRRLVEKALKGGPFESLRTPDGIVLDPLYRPARDAQPIAGRPGGAGWRIVQRLDHTDPRAAGLQAQADLAGGADALALVFAGAPSAHGFGLPANAEALAAVLDGVRLDGLHLRIEPHPAAGRTAAWLRDLASHRGAAPEALDVSFGLDPVGMLARWGFLHFPWPDVARRLAEGGRKLASPGSPGILCEADGRVWHEAGATAGQELGAVLGTAAAMLRALAGHGWDPAEALARIGVTLSADCAPVETISKLRAARLLFARLREACGVLHRAIRLHAETSRRMMSRADPHTNILRTTIAAFAAGIGGADSVAVLPYTDALGLADSSARRLARNTQAILMEESNLHRLTDPAIGSGAIEALTDGLAETGWREFQAIERESGIVESLAAGAIQRRIDESARALRQAYESGAAHRVGATIHPDPNPVEAPVLDRERRPEPAVENAALRADKLTPLVLPEAAGDRAEART